MPYPAPLLLVDIDGVLNVYGVDECPPGYSEYSLFPEDEEPIRLAVMHGAWLRELGSIFDLVWASGWGFQANGLVAPILGIDELPFVPMPEIPFPPREKVPSIDAYVGDRAVAWIDDVVVPEARRWASGRAAPTLLVEIDHTVGLQRGHVEELLTWAADLTGAGDGETGSAARMENDRTPHPRERR